MLHANNRSVNVSRVELISALKGGRERHAIDYATAAQDYEDAAIKFLSDALKRAKKGDLSDIHFKLPKPENHTGDYDEIIAMMEQSVDSTISLDSPSFRAYFLGEWDWKRGFDLAMTSLGGYLGKH
ncbi:hypothetical protein [Pseudomonas nitroreducens]|uniref:hypothetical protein n=1 Tax=Pseudomonas nitroreducens TaxID=46680 RepID=UPI0026591090|nr:hypothetical protein [Pseudomonas nitroreducens]MCP1651661.1 hypothetical protein [Pseudomonas nitroreducens]MCP1684474.1 hypothetical protein [Pseudomonas nitroreducens]